MTNGAKILTNGSQVTNITEEFDRQQVDTDTTATTTTPINNGMRRLLIGISIGATLGGIASILSNKNAIERINLNVQKFGNIIDKTATGINNTVRDIGEAVQNVAVVVNDTFQDIEVTVKGTAEDVGETVKSTVSTVQKTAESVDRTVKTTAEVINTAKQPLENMDNQSANNSANNADNETSYKTVPIE